MRYKKKYLLTIVFFGCTLCYLNITNQDLNVQKNALEMQIEELRQQLGITTTVKSIINTTRIAPIKLPPTLIENNFTFLANRSSQYDSVWAHKYLPHVKDIQYIRPRVRLSKGRSNVTLVLGVPTVKRPSNDTYIIDTIQSVFDACTDIERQDLIVVVSISEPWNQQFENELLVKLIKRFRPQLEEGSLEIIAPHPEFYPNLDTLKLSLGDPRERVKWRSKQNLDYGFLMMHCAGRAHYYMQIEDDLNTSKGFVTSIKKFVTNTKKEWISVAFSQLGYIGRLYHDKTVTEIMEYLLSHFDKKPCDWLQFDYLRAKVCPAKMDKKACDKISSQYAWLVTPTIFQHRGFKSSFKGNINKLQDSFFGDGKKKAEMYKNPKPKALLTSISAQPTTSLNLFYESKGIFWGNTPVKGDVIELLYDPPISIASIDMISGGRKNIKDIIENATLEVLPVNQHIIQTGPNNITDSSEDINFLTQIAQHRYLSSFPTVPLYYNNNNINNNNTNINNNNNNNNHNTQDVSPLRPELQQVEITRQNLLPMVKDQDKFYVVGEFKDGRVSVKIPKEPMGPIRIVRIRLKETPAHWIILEQVLILLHTDNTKGAS